MTRLKPHFLGSFLLQREGECPTCAWRYSGFSLIGASEPEHRRDTIFHKIHVGSRTDHQVPPAAAPLPLAGGKPRVLSLGSRGSPWLPVAPRGSAALPFHFQALLPKKEAPFPAVALAEPAEPLTRMDPRSPGSMRSLGPAYLLFCLRGLLRLC